MKTNRRFFLKAGLSGGLSVSMRASLLGLPAGFLMSGSTLAAPNSAKFTIVSISGAGESINVNGPGAYPTNNNDLARKFDHPTERITGLNITDTINGTAVDVRDLENSADITLGNQRVKAARAYTALDTSFLSNMACFFHRTQANAHAELPSVLRARGALKQISGRGSEQLPSAIAQELAPRLGTLMSTPVVLGGKYSYNGAPLNTYRPTTLQDMMTNDASLGIAPDDFGVLYDWSLDNIYKDVKQNGTPKQKSFLDNHLSSRAQASGLGEELGALITGIDNNSQESQLRTALALFKLRITPVVALRHNYGGDNHSDEVLANETKQTFDALKSLDSYWKLLQEYNLTNDVLYTTIDVFGRTPKRSGRGGRDHYGLFTNALIHGAHINGGIIGGLEELGRNNDIHATGINSITGLSRNPDIDGDNTLAALFKTVMAAAGVDENRLNIRIPDGRVVNALLS